MTLFDTRVVVLPILAATICLIVGTGHPQNIPPPARYSVVRNPELAPTTGPQFTTKTKNEMILDEINVDVTPSISPWVPMTEQDLPVGTPIDAFTGDDLYFDGDFKGSSATKQEAEESNRQYTSPETLHLHGPFSVETGSVTDSTVKKINLKESLDFLRRDSESRSSMDYIGSSQMGSSSRNGVKGGRGLSSATKESTLDGSEALPQTSSAGRPCDAQIKRTCFKWGPRAMGWEAAQQHCRSEGGFLAGHQHLKHLQQLWRDEEGTPFAGDAQFDFRPPEEVEPNSTETHTWTGLAKEAGHHQWLTQSPGYGRFTEWFTEWMDGCPTFGLSSASFRLADCSDRLRFACILSPAAEAEWSPEDLELRVSYNGSSEESWTTLRKQDFNRALLACNWYNRTSRLKLQRPQTDVFWVKVRSEARQIQSEMVRAKVRAEAGLRQN